MKQGFVGVNNASWCAEPHCQTPRDQGVYVACGSNSDTATWGCHLWFCVRHLHATGVGWLCQRCRALFNAWWNREYCLSCDGPLYGFYEAEWGEGTYLCHDCAEVGAHG